MIYIISGTVYLQSCNDGAILETSTVAYSVFDDALRNMTGGGTLFVKAGLYVISTSITIVGAQDIIMTGEGWGTILEPSASIARDSSLSTSFCLGYIPVICLSGGASITLTNMQFNGVAWTQTSTGSPNALVAFMIENSNHDTLDHLWVRNFKSYGGTLAGVTDSSVTNSYFDNNYADGLLIHVSSTFVTGADVQSQRNIIRGNTFNGSQGTLLSIDAMNEVIEDNTFANESSSGSLSPSNDQVHASIGIGDDGNASRITISYNYFQNYQGFGVHSDPQDEVNHDIVIEGNQFYDCLEPIEAESTKGITITDNVIQSSYNTTSYVTYGIWLRRGSAGLSDVSVVDNFVNDTTESSIYNDATNAAIITGNVIYVTNRLAGGNAGIELYDTANNTISNNLVDLSSVTESVYGIYLPETGSYGNVIEGNQVVGNPSDVLGDGIWAEGAHNSVMNNQVGAFNYCIATQSMVQGIVADNILSATCGTKIQAESSGTTVNVYGNMGYNPLKHIANPWVSATSLIDDSGGSATPTNSTTYTVNFSPKIIMVVITASYGTSTLTIKVDGTQILSLTPTVGDSYTFSLTYGETFYITYENTSNTSITVSGR
jgi:hypothetical protein